MGRDWVYNVDTLATESAVSGEIDTSTDTSPKVILTPSSGKAISTRGVYIFTDSTSGEISVYYTNSGNIIAKIYCSRYYNVTLPAIRFDGGTDESISISWSGLSTGSKIFYMISYKEI